MEAAADAQFDALRLEWKPNAWEIFDALHLSVVCGKPAIIEALVNAARNSFTDDRIRPVDFLGWLNLAVLDFARRDDAGLTTHLLATREAERIRHFKRGGTSAPIALVDLHGLAWCALARQRGITLTINHIYLPLDVLDA